MGIRRVFKTLGKMLNDSIDREAPDRDNRYLNGYTDGLADSIKTFRDECPWVDHADDPQMIVYAFRNKRTGRFVTGTDYRYDPPHQSYNKDCGILLEPSLMWASETYRKRRMSKDIEVVKIRLEEEEP